MLIESPLVFSGDSFVELDKEVFFKDDRHLEQEFQLKLSTRQLNGLIMWREDDDYPRLSDRFELKTEQGYLVCRHRVGSNELELRSLKRINDGKIHSILVKR